MCASSHRLQLHQHRVPAAASLWELPHKFTTISLRFNNFLIQNVPTVCVCVCVCESFLLLPRTLRFMHRSLFLLQAMHFIVQFIDVCHIISHLLPLPLSHSLPSSLCQSTRFYSSFMDLPRPPFWPRCQLLSMRAQWGICITSLLWYFLTIFVSYPLPLLWPYLFIQTPKINNCSILN